jgi:dTMP kinase
MKNNLFIAFEGIDGSGKSTQVKLLKGHLQKIGYKVYATFEPTDGTIGSMIRNILRGKASVDDRTIAGLFVADRLDHLLNDQTGIVKKINEGYTVICDRYCFSSYAYQGTHMDMNWVIDANAMSASILRPDINIFIDVDPAISMQRIIDNRETPELYETLENLEAVRQKFYEAFDKLKDKEKVFIVDGNRLPQVIAEEIGKEIERLLAY